VGPNCVLSVLSMLPMSLDRSIYKPMRCAPRTVLSVGNWLMVVLESRGQYVSGDCRGQKDVYLWLPSRFVRPRRMSP